MDNSKELGSAKISTLLWKFSIPAIIGMLVNALYNIIDRIFIGRSVGQIGLAGLAITLPISSIIMAFGMLVGIGASTLVSIKLGEKDKAMAEQILSTSVILDIVISVIISILGLTFINPILKLFGASNASLPYAKEYIVIILVGAVFQNIGFGINNIIRSEGNPKIAMRTMLVGGILNIILDPIFIFVFNLGIKGAAIATVISQTVNTILVMHYFLSKNSGSTLKIKKSTFNLNIKISLEIFSIGLSPFSMQLAAGAVTALYNKGLFKYGGDIAVAAMGIIASICMLIFMPIFGINQGVQPILGYNYGAKSYKRVKKALKLGIYSGITIASIGFIVVEFFPEVLISMFSKNDPALIKLGAHGIRIDLMFLPIVGYQIVGANYFQAIGKAKISIFLSFLRQVIVLIPIIIILPRFLKLEGLWLSQPLADIAAALVTGYFLYRDIKELNRLEKSKDNKEVLA
ncbi:MATE family efflux transporter [Clostridium ganghwense]|uniref:Multidrug export protein MepA n=1 Tax=Clostridium ganghwense TaxID=312089 RepID=A0ABT4CJ89_9CLOT|nr:MATE family efflux transporter [Clostridium ganghwense]MCY6369114.1 MATE family efflux transporter [Clostridium ganghwense]